MAALFDRRDFSLFAGAVVAGFGVAGSAGGEETAPARHEISWSSAAIHQEVVFAAASAARIYQTLTSTDQFDRVVRLSMAMNTAMKKRLGTRPTQIDARPGGAFTLFGGYVTGRNLELVAGERLVQAWRAASWDPGAYSIAKFVLVDQPAGGKLIFDHTGFPNAAASELAKGWRENYWTPLAQSLT
jgi:activator of HSP90 ATPase